MKIFASILKSTLIVLSLTQVAGQWSKLNVKNKGPSTRAGYSAGISDSGRVYTFGGYRIAGKDKKRVDLDDTWMYNMKSSEWTSITTKGARPTARSFHTSVVRTVEKGDEMYVFGGMAVNAASPLDPEKPLPVLQYNEVWRVSVETKKDNLNAQWVLENIPEPNAKGVPSPRISSSSVIYENNMYIFGGLTYDSKGLDARPSSQYNDVWIYSLEYKNWTQVNTDSSKKIPIPRSSHSASVVTSKKNKKSYMMIHGGRHLQESNGKFSVLSDSWFFSFEKNQWFQVDTTGPVKRAGTYMVKPIGKDDRVWFFGGFDDNVPLDENGIGHVEINLVEGQIEYGSKDTNHDVEFYKTKNQDNPIVRYDHQMVVYKTSLILLGGRQYENKNDGFTEFDLWSFDISKADTSPISMNRIIIMATVIPITCIAIGILGYVGFLKYKKNKKEKLMKNKEEFEEHDAIEIETSSHEKEIEISRSQHRVSLDAVQEPYREMQ